jgi:hypothetical protein
MDQARETVAMTNQTSMKLMIVAVVLLTTLVDAVPRAAATDPSSGANYKPRYTKSGDLVLPQDDIWREWVFVGAPLTPNALKGVKAPLDVSVFSAAGGAILLATCTEFPVSADQLRRGTNK